MTETHREPMTDIQPLPVADDRTAEELVSVALWWMEILGHEDVLEETVFVPPPEEADVG